MENQVPTIDEAVEATLCDCTACLSVPLSILQLELETPISGWDAHLEQRGIRVTTDHLGRKAIPAVAARRLMTERRDRLARLAAEAERRRAAAKPRVVIGFPAQEGMTPYESLVAGSGGIVTPEQEFGLGRAKPRFLEEALDASARELAQKKREAAAKAKRRLADQAKDKLA